MLLKALVLQHFQKQRCQHYWFYNNSKTMLLGPLVLQFSQKKKREKKTQLLDTLTVDSSKHTVAETNGSSNIVFVNVVKPLVSSTSFSEML